MKKIIKAIIPHWMIRKLIKQPIIMFRSLKPLAPRRCNICAYEGRFGLMGRPARLDAECPGCGSLERHRLLMLALEREDIVVDIGTEHDVLHFAPEPILEQIFRKKWSRYRTADICEEADLKLDIEAIDLPDESVTLIIANHVLEHVDDEKASKELHRILVEKGRLLCMVPIVEGWQTTYENPSASTEKERWLHFGQGDHVRFYGRDFRSRIASGGFRLIREITAEGSDVIKHGLVRGEKVFVFEKV